MAKPKLKKQAKAYGKLQVQPARQEVRSQRRQSRRSRKRQLRSNKSMQIALNDALSQSMQDVRNTPGLSERDLAVALGELANRRVQNQAGAVLARRGIESKFAESEAEAKSQLRELRGEQGVAAASRLSELQEAQKDRALEKRSLRIQEQNLDLDRQAQRFDQYIAEEELDLKREELAGKAQEIRKDIKGAFNQASAKLRASTYGENDKPITPEYVRENRGTFISGMAADPSLKGNRILAKAVVQRYLREAPSTAVENYMRRNGVDFWKRNRRQVPGG